MIFWDVFGLNILIYQGWNYTQLLLFINFINQINGLFVTGTFYGAVFIRTLFELFLIIG